MAFGSNGITENCWFWTSTKGVSGKSFIMFQPAYEGEAPVSVQCILEKVVFETGG